MKNLRWLWVPLCALVASACQRYEPKPLDLPGHYRAMLERDVAADDVRAYADQLGARHGPTTKPSTYDPADGLSLAEGEVVALFFNPQLRVSRLKAKAPLVGAAEAGRWEDPEFDIDAERIVQSVAHPWVLGTTLSFTIPLSGRLGVEREKAFDEANAEAMRALAEERSTLAELRTRWVEWSAARERLELTQKLVSEMATVSATAERLRKAGELQGLDARLFAVERVKQTSIAQTLQSDVRAEEMELKARLGLVPKAGVQLTPSLDVSRSASATEDASPETIAGHPRLRVARAEYDVAERAFELEIRKQYPDLKIGGGYGTEDGDDRVLFGAGVPLPILNANRRAIAEARANRDASKAAAEAEYEKLISEIAVAQERLAAADARAQFVKEQLAPLADKQVAEARQLGKLGDFNSLVLLEALTAAHEAKLAVLDARRDAAVAAITLDALFEGRQ